MNPSEQKSLEVESLADLEREIVEQLRTFRNLNSTKKSHFSRNTGVTQQFTQNLIEILRSVKFRRKKKLMSSSGGLKSHFQKRQLEIKVTFQKCIFQSLDFMYKYRLSTHEDLVQFFLNDENIQLTLNHMKGLYDGVLFAGVAEEPWTFEPNFEFILKDWKTKHLHNLLTSKVSKALTPKQEAKFVYGLLLWYLDIALTAPGELTKKARLIEQVKKRPFFKPYTENQPLKVIDGSSFSNSGYNKELSELSQYLTSVIANTAQLEEALEYMIIYHILHFAKTYPIAAESQLVAKEIKHNQDLQLKLEMLAVGKRLQWSAGKVFEFGHFLQNSEQEIFIREEVSKESLAVALSILRETAEEFKEKKARFQAYNGRKDHTLQLWFDNNYWLRRYDEIAFADYKQYYNMLA
ncbi:hypothetical protein O181_003797 [Austropuccinia psidii MF-1]|uniref:Uncharacterized protein n=1 Tax=Austropuccinia psidii MF-1 TaxID=1389203 RepID=A0A9Q3GF74_9BASI|nr:hypothetical protein [Austropuccinia psidii MF-1]